LETKVTISFLID